MVRWLYEDTRKYCCNKKKRAKKKKKEKKKRNWALKKTRLKKVHWKDHACVKQSIEQRKGTWLFPFHQR